MLSFLNWLITPYTGSLRLIWGGGQLCINKPGLRYLRIKYGASFEPVEGQT